MVIRTQYCTFCSFSLYPHMFIGDSMACFSSFQLNPIQSIPFHSKWHTDKTKIKMNFRSKIYRFLSYFLAIFLSFSWNFVACQYTHTYSYMMPSIQFYLLKYCYEVDATTPDCDPFFPLIFICTCTLYSQSSMVELSSQSNAYCTAHHSPLWCST